MRTTRVLAIIAILGIAFSFRASANVVYDSETTNDWFSVDMASLTTEALQTSPWTPPSPDGEAVVDGAVIKLDTDLGDPLTYTADQASDAVAIVAAEMTATVNAAEPELDSVPQAALCVIGTETATNWVGLVGADNDKGCEWVTFETPVPVAGETYSVRIEFDQRQGESRRIRYRVGDTVLGDGWYPNPQNTAAANIRSVSFSGSGDISGLGGSNVVANVATFDGIGYATFADALAAAKAAGEDWNEANPIVLYENADWTAETRLAYFNENGRKLTISEGVFTKSGNFTYDVTANADCEALIGTAYYKTLDAALAAGAGRTVTINKDLTGDRIIEITSGLTLAINEKKITCTRLAVAANTTLTLNGNLAVADASILGSVAGDTLTVSGTLTGVNVAKLTFGDNATFAYGDAPIASTTTLTLGNLLTITGLDDAEIGTTVIDNEAVAGARLSMFNATVKDGAELGIVGNELKIVKATPDIEIEIGDDKAGYDFTNGTINVNATVKSGKSGTLTLTVVNFDGTVRGQVSQSVSESGKVTFDLNDLTAGGTYSYTVEVSEGGKDLGTSYGTFTAANWNDDIWFGADATTGDAQTGTLTNGAWEGTAPTIDGKAYVIEEDSIFTVEDQSPGSNCVTRVDAQVTFESLVDAESLETADGALGGFVAASANDDTQWMALGATASEWLVLTGAIKPSAGVTYVVRAEVDFLSPAKRVRYLVSEDDGANFYPLVDANGKQWLPLSASDKGSLAAVELKGSGKLAKIEAIVSDKAIAEVNDVKYGTMAAALEAAGTEGTNTIKLLTNATIEPDLKTPGKYAIAPNSHDYMSGGKVSSDAKTIIVEGTGKPPVVRLNDAEMQQVRVPGVDAPVKNTDKLRKFLEDSKIGAYTDDNASAARITTALLTQDTANGLVYWQDYALGINVGTSVAPVTIPTGDTDEKNITLAIPAVTAATPSGDYDITYKVGEEVAEGAPQTIKIPLDAGTGTYSIKAVFTPKTEPEQTKQENL